jgi:hypothetical protein
MKVRARLPYMQNADALPHGVTAGKDYLVLGIEADDYRLLNDELEPVIYSSSLFEVVDSQEPSSWIHQVGSDGEHYAYPPELGEPGFFEDYHDGLPGAVMAFRRYLESLGQT